MSDKVVRLGAFVDLWTSEDAAPNRVDFSIEQFAILADGRRVVLDLPRAWSEVLRAVGYSGPPLDAWSEMTADHIEDSARNVIIPDDDDDPEPLPWDEVIACFAEHGITVTAEELKPLPHDVVLSDAILARLPTDPRA